jgi:hypothetical protein
MLRILVQERHQWENGWRGFGRIKTDFALPAAASCEK